MDDIHNPFIYSVGQWVVVEKRVEKAKGWCSVWTPSMDKLLGLKAKIVGVSKSLGYQVEKRRVGKEYFPSNALRTLSAEPVAIEVPSV